MSHRPRALRRLVAVPAVLLALSGAAVAAAGAAQAEAPAAGATTIQMTIVNNSFCTMHLAGKSSDGTVDESWQMREIPAKSTAVVTARADRGFGVDLDYDLDSMFDPSCHAHVRLHADTTTPGGGWSHSGDGVRVTSEQLARTPDLSVRYTVNG